MSMHHDAELRAFHAAARLGGMSAAARQLGLTQPTVSAHVARLEKLYGLELFYRRGRSVELTDFGRSLLATTHRLFDAEAEALTMLLQGQSAYRGKLRICAVGPYNVMPMIREFRARHSGVQIAMSLGDSRQIVERILDYQGDVGLLVHAVDDPRILCLPHRRQPLVVFCAAGHPLAALESPQLADLAGQLFVLREPGSTTRLVLEQALRRCGVSIRCDVEMGSREAVHEAVAQGLGLGVVSETAYRHDPRTVKLPLRSDELVTHAHVVCLKERAKSVLVARFLDVACQLGEERAG
ncbi:MAG TPA: LysR substrate-binding domain-containing protein [Ramlibacter sp.]|nr:LysR substrate-binding domain-containing protein [Ramlibacter sp.]